MAKQQKERAGAPLATRGNVREDYTLQPKATPGDARGRKQRAIATGFGPRHRPISRGAVAQSAEQTQPAKRQL